ncbi:MAG: hypothetical protein HZA51_13515 [Planctomycetes bacterium]|nr:hypothetical protein [Planctomycetota bacterium]
MKHGFTLSFLVLTLLTGSASARADIIVEQLPDLLGGPYSDTDYLNMFGQPRWQREADNILLSQDAIVRRITWWGFYGGSGTPATPPPATQSIQIRIMGARGSDGLPDETAVLMDVTFYNTSRISTGRIIGVGGSPIEQQFSADLTMPVSLQSGVAYWLEIVQLGDINSGLRWESSLDSVPNHAFINPLTPGWVSAEGGLAFQLLDVPEPAGCTVILMSATVVIRFGRRVRR